MKSGLSSAFYFPELWSLTLVIIFITGPIIWNDPSLFTLYFTPGFYSNVHEWKQKCYIQD